MKLYQLYIPNKLVLALYIHCVYNINMNKLSSLPPRDKLARLPSAFIPESLLKRMQALLTHRGDYTVFINNAILHEIERMEKDKAES